MPEYEVVAFHAGGERRGTVVSAPSGPLAVSKLLKRKKFADEDTLRAVFVQEHSATTTYDETLWKRADKFDREITARPELDKFINGEDT